MTGSKEEDILECPFCDNETIEVVKIRRFKSSSRGYGRDFKMKMRSVDCSNCGKEESDIRKKLKRKGFPFR